MSIYGKFISRDLILPFMVIGVWVLVSVTADLIASEVPLFYKDGRGWHLGDSEVTEQSSQDLILKPVPFNPGSPDMENGRFAMPGSKSQLLGLDRSHVLGTDALGRDVLSGIIHASGFSLKISMASLTLIIPIGLLIGLMAGFFGDRTLRLKPLKLTLILLWLFFCSYWVLQQGSFLSKAFLSLGLGIILYLFGKPLSSKPFFSKMKFITIPLDFLTSRFLEVFQSIPNLFLLLVLVALWDPSDIRLVVALSLTLWTGLAKIVRAKTMALKETQMVRGLISLGVPTYRILFKHILPIILPDILIYSAYSLGTVLLLESSLSFLGLGTDPAQVSWGSILSMAQQKPSNWWLALAPGLCIFAVVYSTVRIGNSLRGAFAPEHLNWSYYDLV